MEPVGRQFISRVVSEPLHPLSLYDQYGSMAYGIILQIIPEPEAAQAVLIDLFTAPQLPACIARSAHPAGEIIRLARTKALSTRPSSADVGLFLRSPDEHYTLEKQVFELSFCQGYSVDVIAETCQLSRASILKSIFVYVKQLRFS